MRRAPLVIAFVAIALLAVAVGVLTAYIVVLKDARDTESARIDQRITTSMCDLLDQFPAGGLLERPRHKFHCGPGLPADITPRP